MKNTLLFFILSLLPFKVFALPGKLEVIFLSHGSSAILEDIIKKHENLKISKQLAANELSPKDCVPMGGGCFHPQLGFVERKGTILKANPDLEEKETNTGQMKVFNSTDVDLIKCNKEYYFDIFCGKAKKEKSKSESSFEIWVDTSSSMRGVDFSKEIDFCHRRSFIERIQKACTKDVSVSIFNTSIKALGDPSGVCRNYGNNNQRRFFDWVNGSSAKHLLVITDIDEMSKELKSYLDRVGGIIRGVGSNEIPASKLISLVDSYLSSCK